MSGARKAVEKNRLAGRQSGKFLLEDVQHNFVRNKLASLHVRLSSQTDLSLLGDVLAQQVASGNLWKRFVCYNACCVPRWESCILRE